MIFEQAVLFTTKCWVVFFLLLVLNFPLLINLNWRQLLKATCKLYTLDYNLFKEGQLLQFKFVIPHWPLGFY